MALFSTKELRAIANKKLNEITAKAKAMATSRLGMSEAEMLESMPNRIQEYTKCRKEVAECSYWLTECEQYFCEVFKYPASGETLEWGGMMSGSTYYKDDEQGFRKYFALGC